MRAVLVPILLLLIVSVAAATVHNSAWDGSVSQVEDFLDDFLRDPDSRQDIDWYKVVSTDDNQHWMVRYKFRAKNGFGGYVVNDWTFFILQSTEVVDIVIDAQSYDIVYTRD